ncbi:MAG: class I SAM-dependent methyltransferase [Mariprofundaceae bacterium]
MDEKQRQRIIDKHRDSLTRYGYSPHALYWSSREIQEIRFQALAEVGIEAGDSVLDVGCGFGDFKAWSEAQGRALDYTGIDLSPDLLAEAKKHHSDGEFFAGDLFDMTFADQGFDWVVLSGALNEQLHDAGAYARRVIERMYVLCRKGVAFNLLDARHRKAHDLQSYLPDKMLNWCHHLCPNCTLRDDYLDNDFTIYMHRS